MYEKVNKVLIKAKELIVAYETGDDDIDRITQLEKELPYDVVAIEQELLTMFEGGN